MVKGLIVLFAVAGSLVLAPVSSAAVESFSTTLEADIVDSDGNCCGTYYAVVDRIHARQIPGVRPGQIAGRIVQGDFDAGTPDSPDWIDLTYTARGGKGSFRLRTAVIDDAHSFTWVLIDGTGRYAGWTGSGTFTYSITWFDNAELGDVLGEASLTLTGVIGPS